MKPPHRRRVAVGAGLAAALGVGAAAGYWSGASQERAAGTRLDIVACGIASAPQLARIPSELLERVSEHAPLNIGPVFVPGVREPVRVRFVPVPSEEQKRVTKSGGEVSVAVVVGERRRALEAVTLKCRHGDLATAAYDYGREQVELPIVRL